MKSQEDPQTDIYDRIEGKWVKKTDRSVLTKGETGCEDWRQLETHFFVHFFHGKVPDYVIEYESMKVGEPSKTRILRDICHRYRPKTFGEFRFCHDLYRGQHALQEHGALSWAWNSELLTRHFDDTHGYPLYRYQIEPLIWNACPEIEDPREFIKQIYKGKIPENEIAESTVICDGYTLMDVIGRDKGRFLLRYPSLRGAETMYDWYLRETGKNG